MTAFYSEHDPYAAQYLRNLIAAGLIAPGVVDERDLQDVEPFELQEFTQVHLCAGIGIWSGALRAAGWPDDEPIWTGSFPCQPFSQAGQRKGINDERHLWPTGLNLITQCRPARFAGEQVASKDGRAWLDTVSADLEALGFAFGASDLCAAGFQQAHIRQRNYFAGLADFMQPGRPERWTGAGDGSSPSSSVERVADDDDARLEGRAGMLERGNQRAIGPSGMVGGLAKPEHNGRRIDEPRRGLDRGVAIGRGSQSGTIVGLAHNHGEGPFPATHRGIYPGETSAGPRHGEPERSGNGSADSTILHPGKIASRWHDVDWLLCRNPDGKPSWRPVEPGTFPLAHGISSRMGKLRAYGNALDWETAKAFCEVLVEICGITPRWEL